MKFLIDAHFPISLKKWLIARGHDAIHTFDLPDKNLTDDMEIIRIADLQSRIVTSKDSDFQKHHIITGRPDRILMVTTGNIINKVLFQLFEKNFSTIETAFQNGHKVVELSNTSIIIHE
jgi:predicted nuclease of predicted toxin-antitoxin system